MSENGGDAIPDQVLKASEMLDYEGADGSSSKLSSLFTENEEENNTMLLHPQQESKRISAGIMGGFDANQECDIFVPL